MMLRLGLALLALLLFASTSVTTADNTGEPRTLVVAQDGSGQYRSIQSAIDEARKGDTILIRPGAYREDVRIHNKERIKLVGAGMDQVTLVGSDVVGVLFVGKLPYGAADIEISGMTVNEHGGQSVGIFLGRRILLRAIRVNGLLFGQQAEALRIEDSILGGSETTGVQFVDSQAVLAGNFIHDNDHGVNVVGNSEVRLERNIITRSLFEGVVVGDRAKAVLISNTIVKNGGGAAFLGTSQVQARGNIVTMNRFGFMVSPSSRVTMGFNALSNSDANYVRQGFPPQPAPELRPDSDLTAEAEFVDTTRDDFRLKADTALAKIGEFAFLGALPPVAESH
ncbi:MAG TPA: pectinesterase family protein [Nitrospiraceae bacterium]|nr:pectinesterase family protein [Nitrospiraceae bacterium]